MLRDAVMVVKDDEDETVVHETTDLVPDRTALSGADVGRVCSG